MPTELSEFDKAILNLLEEDARIPHAQIADTLGVSEDQVREAIEALERSKTIVGYRPIINPEQTGLASCVIEVRVSPERGVGFDSVAECIYQFPEVQSLYLMSGGYDFLVIIEGRTVREIALFVMEKLATLNHVHHTTTHFLLKKYKENGVIMVDRSELKRLAVAP